VPKPLHPATPENHSENPKKGIVILVPYAMQTLPESEAGPLEEHLLVCE
jgi:hypothetical protein